MKSEITNITPNTITTNIISNSKSSKKSSQIKICCITWNMHGQTPTLTDVQDLLADYQNYDIYVIGTEECLRSILVSIVYWTKGAWEDDILTALGNNYKLIKSETLSAIHIVVFAKLTIAAKISSIGSSYVKSGIMNLVGNKGAVMVWFKLYDARLLFIDCHLASGKSNNDRRIIDYNYILDTINKLDCDGLFDDMEYPNEMTILDLFSLCVFMGDFNWRIENTSLFIKNHLDKPDLFPYDQRNISIDKKELEPRGFCEQDIHFLPTYKYQHDTDQHIFESNERLPGWTDRIFYRISSYGISGIKFDGYTAKQNIQVSDHKPVFLECYITL